LLGQSRPRKQFRDQNQKERFFSSGIGNLTLSSTTQCPNDDVLAFAFREAGDDVTDRVKDLFSVAVQQAKMSLS
jgi:hypothetical protein